MRRNDYLEIIRYHAKDILESKGMNKEKKFIQHGNVSVYEHSINVTIECLKIIEYTNIPVDIKSLIRGSLLHDYFLYDWHIPDKSHNWHGFIHANIALKNAQKDFKLNEIEKNMIKRHMFPLNIIPPKYREGIILCIADKIVATKETIEPYIIKLEKIKTIFSNI